MKTRNSKATEMLVYPIIVGNSGTTANLSQEYKSDRIWSCAEIVPLETNFSRIFDLTVHTNLLEWLSRSRSGLSVVDPKVTVTGWDIG
jgi:hypothetical protein